MQRNHINVMVGGALLSWVVSAHGQEAPARPAAATGSRSATEQQPAAPAKGAVVPSVTVAGERPANRIDRQVYEVKSDISSTNGSAADALNNVPSVNVDPDGSVSLRGSSNVQIMVDGKPSAMLQGDNRGPALQAMTADDIESVEVINNPGAEFGNEAGGGPILNLVMKRNRKAGGNGTVNANGGSKGRYNGAVSGTYNEGAWGFQGGLNVRHDGRNPSGTTERDQLDSRSGQFAHTSQYSNSAGLNDMLGANGTVSYNLGQTDTLTASVNYNGRSNDQHGTDRYIEYLADTDSAVSSDYTRTTRRTGDSKNYAWGARWDHKGELPGESLKIDLRVSGSLNQNDTDYANTYAVLAPGSANSRAYQDSSSATHIADFTGDYERPLAGGVFKAGYKVATNDSNVDTQYYDIDTAIMLPRPNAARSNNFKLDETVSALYATYQMRLNQRWGVLGGLRSEYTAMDIQQFSSQAEASNHYLNFMPSAFATYKLDDNSNLRFAYARRIRRPQQNDLNPAVLYRDELNVQSGNPKLKPTKTDSFEIGYETKVAGLETALRGYYRRDTDAIVDRRYFIADNVLLTTRENGAGSHAGGLEFTIGGKLSKELTLNASGNLARNQQTVQDINGNEVVRTANALSGRVRLNYQLGANDQLQAALQMRGKMLSGTGYRSPNSTFNLNYRHSITPSLSLAMNVTDLFNTNKQETIVDSDTLRETSTRRFDGRVIYVGLSYRFGGAAGTQSEGGERRGGPGRPGGYNGGGPGGGEG